MKRQAIVLLTAISALTILHCAGTRNSDINLITIDEEIEIGAKIAKEIEKQNPLVNDVEISAFISELGNKIAAASDWSGLKYRFRIINTNDINAFSIPGGHIYLHRGLIEYTETVSELAGIIAHEIYHIVSRHGAEQITNKYGLAIAAQELVGENTALWQQVAADIFTEETILDYGKKHEFEADNLGVEYAYRAGYDPRGLLVLLERMEQMELEQQPRIQKRLLTHPNLHQRIKKIRKSLKTFPDDFDYIRDTTEFQSIRNQLRALPRPTSMIGSPQD